MKNLSERGLLTIITMIVVALGVAGIIIVGHIQDVQSQQWQEDIRIIEVINE